MHKIVKMPCKYVIIVTVFFVVFIEFTFQ